MRIVITEMPGARPIVVEGLKAVLLAALDAKADGTAPVVAKGQPRQIAQCAVMALMSVRHKLGEEMFEAVIRVARENEYLSAEDITDKVRAAPTRAEMSRDPSALDSGSRAEPPRDFPSAPRPKFLSYDAASALVGMFEGACLQVAEKTNRGGDATRALVDRSGLRAELIACLTGKAND